MVCSSVLSRYITHAPDTVYEGNDRIVKQDSEGKYKILSHTRQCGGGILFSRKVMGCRSIPKSLKMVLADMTEKLIKATLNPNKQQQ